VTRLREGTTFADRGKGFLSFSQRPYWLCGPTYRLSMDIGLFPRVERGWSVMMTTYLHIMPRFRMRGAIHPPPISLRIFRPLSDDIFNRHKNY
jgi:hypothetical protein